MLKHNVFNDTKNLIKKSFVVNYIRLVLSKKYNVH